MHTEDEVLTNKIFLNRANIRSKAKSWLKGSTGEETEATSTSQSKTNDEAVDDEITAIVVGDELSGIGVPSKAGNDDPSNRQLMSANDALRRKLLSKDAYKKYSEGKANGAEKSRPRSQKVDLEDEPQEGKGRSLRQGELSPQTTSTGAVDDNKAAPFTASKPIPKNKKRPSSYLDQLLADRQNKQQKKAKRKSDDD